jgi:hypothetical protein
VFTPDCFSCGASPLIATTDKQHIFHGSICLPKAARRPESDAMSLSDSLFLVALLE